MSTRWMPIGLLLTALTGVAQQVTVYSPFTRIDPFGQIVKADRSSAEPRHILSPGIPRNGSTPLRIAVELDKPDEYWLEIGQNPENSVRATLYKETFVQTPDGWIPDALVEVKTPYHGLPSDFGLPGQKVVTFWLEMDVSRTAEVARVKVEPQLYPESYGDWIVYPMEVRILPHLLPDKPVLTSEELPPITAPSDAVLLKPLQDALCGSGRPPAVRQSAPASMAPGALTNRSLLRRSVQQDLRSAPNRAKLTEAFLKSSGVPAVRAWCSAPARPAGGGTEWYLPLRDAIYRQSGPGN